MYSGNLYDSMDKALETLGDDRPIANPAKQGEAISAPNQGLSVGCVVCTRNRYDTTLSLCIAALSQQTYPLDEVFIYDDSDKPIDLREKEPYKQLFILLQQKGIPYRVVYGNGLGQVRGHRISLKETKSAYIWRVDDDDIPEPTVLEKLMLVMEANPNCGACGGLVLDVANSVPSNVASNKIEDIYLGLNKQWFRHSGKPYEVDHLYSTFVYKRTGDYYPSGLSRVGHREETIMTYRMKRAGFKIMVEPNAVTWHLKSHAGGIRDGYKEMWDADEAVFSELMRDWGVKTNGHKIITLDSGIGDHYAFKSILPELIRKYGNGLTLACCYPDIFRDYKVNIISIAEAYAGNHREGIYKFMFDNNWKGNIIDAYKQAYLT